MSVQTICLHFFPKTVINITLNYISILPEYSFVLEFFLYASLGHPSFGDCVTYVIMCVCTVLKNVLLIADCMQILSF
jgi:hypothetical protein